MKPSRLLLIAALAMSHGGMAAADTAGDAPAAVRPKEMTKAPPPEQSLYQYLISEIATQRGYAGLAWQGMMDLARKTRDPRVARRAVEVAFQARQFDEAVDSALLWADLEPASPGPRQALGVLAGTQGPLDGVSPIVAKWLADPAKTATVLLQLPGILARYPEKAKVAAAVRDLVKDYSKLPEANWAVAQAALSAGELDTASGAIEEALKQKPEWAHAVLLKAQILREKSEDTAASYLKSFLDRHPDETEVRVGYARMLVAQKSLLSAREQFRLLAKESPADIEMPYSIALISQQIEDYADAEAQYKRVLELMPRDVNPVFFNLGLVAEGRKDIEGALSWYRQIGEGEYFVSSKLKIASILGKRDGIEAGRKFLREMRDVETGGPEVRSQMILAEVQLLREAKAYPEAFAVLNESIAKTPDAADLLYDRAMIAEKLDKLDVLEADLKRVIALQPDRSHAYNALGYTLVERNVRLDEARELLEKAVKLSPEDPYIQDSVGWLQFRQGRIDDAITTLRKAYQARRDAEIAAHLGEVLWVSGRKDEAAGVWQTALKENPGSEALTAIIEKFKR